MDDCNVLIFKDSLFPATIGNYRCELFFQGFSIILFSLFNGASYKTNGASWC